jgi:1,4-alpha-glucan branching enzyme
MRMDKVRAAARRNLEPRNRSMPPRPDIDAIVRADHGDPFAVLGPHVDNGVQVFRAFLPDARAVSVIDPEGRVCATLEKVDDAGFWQGAVRAGSVTPPHYRYRVATHEGVRDLHDTYAFPPVLGELDVHLLTEGTHMRTYERLGAHPRVMNGIAGVSFAVWAPNAQRVSVVGGFCNWDGRRLPMRKRHGCGIWELFVPDIAPGEFYKYEIRAASGAILPLKTDPFALAAEHPPRTAAVVADINDIAWNDGEWMARRGETTRRDAAMSIYEVHLGSWRRVPEQGARYLTYRELADQLVPYVRDMGFTHIELMPVSEYPFDGSWGYQPVGLYAPTSRFGSPQDFAYFIDQCHRAGLGVLADWVAAHFPTDPHGLGLFDGTHLYEHADPRRGFHRDWNTLIYNYGRREVVNYLLGNALFWLDRYHLDGLRVDAVASMLYLDYSREPGDWVPNAHGGRENLEAIAFLRRMNELAYGLHPGITTVAEESTAWPGVSRPTDGGGLGFGYKWNMGWMHDTLKYMSEDPVHRPWHHDKMTFGMIYAYSENFILPLSHDEVVHGKGSLIARMPGDRWQRFANLRAYFGFMFGHPGKKLLFMGAEFAQEREWNHDVSLDWHLLNDPAHGGVHALVRDLNATYRRVGALHQRDHESDGFAWIVGDDRAQSVFAFLRFGHDRARPVLVVSNFTPVPRAGYRIGVPTPGYWREQVNTDADIYGGSNMGNGGGVMTDNIGAHGHAFSLCLTLPPLATLILERLPS